METASKIWGQTTRVFLTHSCDVSFLEIKKGGTCSLHHHMHKHNLFFVISGLLDIKLSGSARSSDSRDHHRLGPNGHLHINPLQSHQFSALEDTKAIEIMYVEYDSDDIIRETLGYLSIPNCGIVELISQLKINSKPISEISQIQNELDKAHP